MTGDPVRSFPVGLRNTDALFIERIGVGTNLSAKLRSILDRCRDIMGNVSERDDAQLVYEQNEDGERKWCDEPPFPIDRKAGWQGIPRAAAKAGFAHQVVSQPEKGTVHVWVAPTIKLRDCESCRRRVTEAMKGAK